MFLKSVPGILFVTHKGMFCLGGWHRGFLSRGFCPGFYVRGVGPGLCRHTISEDLRSHLGS